MANGAYAKGIRHLLTDVAWESAVLKAVAVDIQGGNYSVDLVVHEFLNAIDSVDRVATSAALTGALVNDDGVLVLDPDVLTAVTGGVGVLVGAVIIYAEVGGDTTSPLLLYLDEMSGLPFDPNGTNLDLIWNTGPDGVARI